MAIWIDYRIHLALFQVLVCGHQWADLCKWCPGHTWCDLLFGQWCRSLDPVWCDLIDKATVPRLLSQYPLKTQPNIYTGFTVDLRVLFAICILWWLMPAVQKTLVNQIAQIHVKSNDPSIGFHFIFMTDQRVLRNWFVYDVHLLRWWMFWLFTVRMIFSFLFFMYFEK